jgi:hypothetical protein
MSKEVFHKGDLDWRFSAYPHFKHYVEEKERWVRAGVDPLPDVNFFNLREWCWETFGPSKEFRYWQAHKNPNVIPTKRSNNAQWCWDTEFGKQRIYFTDEALVLFNLKWI